MARNRDEYWAFPKALMVYTFLTEPNEKKGDLIDTIIKALVHRQRDVHPLADAALDAEEDYYQQRKEAGARGNAAQGKGDAARVRGDAARENPDAARVKNDARTNKRTNEKTKGTYELKNETETETETELTEEAGAVRDSGSGSASLPLKENPLEGCGEPVQVRPPRSTAGAGCSVNDFLESPTERVDDLGGAMLPLAMAEYCHERGNGRAVNAFKKAVRQDEEKAREKFRQFVAECEAGQEPDNRGAALTARLDYAGLVNGAASRKNSGNETIRGVRVSNKGGVTTEDIPF